LPSRRGWFAYTSQSGV